MIVCLSQKQVNTLLEAARRNMPIESCGVLFGKLEKKEVLVMRIAPMRNLFNSSTEFKIDPEEMLREIKTAESNGMELVGFFHSHPTHLRPSLKDIECMRFWPKTIWLIISSSSGEKAAFTMDNGKISEIRTRIYRNT